MIFTQKEVNKIVYPLIGQQLLAIVVGIVDSLMVSSAGEAAISGVGLIGVLHTLLLYLFSAFCTGGSILLSLSFGEKNVKKSENVTMQLIWSSCGVAVIVTLISVMFRSPLLNLIYGKTDPEVMKNAKEYFLYLALGYPFLAVSNAGYAIFRSMGNTKISLNNSIMINVINIIGNAVLIYGFKMGAKGAAIATSFSWAVSSVTMMLRLRDRRNLLYIDNIFKWKPDFKMIKNICSVGIPNGIENSMFQFGKLITQSLIATFAISQITANSVSSTIVNMQYGIGTAMGASIITIVGRCVGAQEKQQAKDYAKKLMKMTYVMTIGVSLFICVFAKPITQLYNLSGETAGETIKLLVTHSICAAVIWPSAFTLPSVFRSASDVKYTMVISVISMWTFRVLFSYIFGGYMGMGVLGVWIAMYCDWVFRAGLFIVRYIKGTWLTKYNREM